MFVMTVACIIKLNLQQSSLSLRLASVVVITIIRYDANWSVPYDHKMWLWEHNIATLELIYPHYLLDVSDPLWRELLVMLSDRFFLHCKLYWLGWILLVISGPPPNTFLIHMQIPYHLQVTILRKLYNVHLI